MAEIRRTVSRAFGRDVDPLKQGQREEIQGNTALSQRVHRAFEELHELIQNELGKRAAAWIKAGRCQLSPRKPGAEGLEFSLLTPYGKCRFVDSQNGYFWVHYQDRSPTSWRMLYSFHKDDSDRLELVGKDLSYPRSAFQFTTLAQIVEKILGT